LPSSFGIRLADAFVAHGQLCVGVDPHSALLEDWGLSDDVAGLESFSNTVIDEAAGRVGIIKPQVSFFERFGSKGFAVLEAVCERATQAGLLVIMDIKRGDIGSTMDGYFEAWLGQSAPFICDAVTVSPYLGFDSLKPFMAAATERGKGVFVLAATSNPEAAVLQQAMVTEESSVAASVWAGLESVNNITALPGQSIGNFGAVLGATLNLNRFGLGQVTTTAQPVATPILAPGFGAQGARLADAGRLFGVAAHQTIASVSRSVLQAGALGLDTAIDQAKQELAEGLA
jgi:orotidine-5'-phosphate decarboxylase